jgi:hypothetical protein
MLRNAAVLGLGRGRLEKLPPMSVLYAGVKPLPVPGVNPVRNVLESKPASALGAASLVPFLNPEGL